VILNKLCENQYIVGITMVTIALNAHRIKTSEMKIIVVVAGKKKVCIFMHLVELVYYHK
jgi:hypothetical protein